MSNQPATLSAGTEGMLQAVESIELHSAPIAAVSLRDLVVACARSWIGTPYRHQASAKGTGCDCIGLIGGVALEIGFASGKEWDGDPAIKSYGPIPSPPMLLAAVTKYLVPIPIAMPGDILLLRFVQEPHHFAILSSSAPMRITHAYAAARKCCETSIDGEWRSGVSWRSLIVSAWRYRELS